ncbi:unnamed protein product [Rhizopus stolonifer]
MESFTNSYEPVYKVDLLTQPIEQRLATYKQRLWKDYKLLSEEQKTTASEFIVNSMDPLQCESYLKYKVFNQAEINLFIQADQLSRFDQEKQIELLLDPIKMAYNKGQLKGVQKVLHFMKSIQAHSSTSFISENYSFIKILDYM